MCINWFFKGKSNHIIWGSCNFWHCYYACTSCKCKNFYELQMTHQNSRWRYRGIRLPFSSWNSSWLLIKLIIILLLLLFWFGSLLFFTSLLSGIIVDIKLHNIKLRCIAQVATHCRDVSNYIACCIALMLVFSGIVGYSTSKPSAFLLIVLFLISGCTIMHCFHTVLFPIRNSV